MAYGESTGALLNYFPQPYIYQERAKDSRIGIDARMISHEKATLINAKITQMNSKLIYPPQNLIDLIWKDKPQKSKAPIFTQPIEFAGAFIHGLYHEFYT